jgi:hypothetical protein
MEQTASKNFVVLIGAGALVVGLVGGYFFGVGKGDEAGRAAGKAALLAEQAAERERAVAAAEKELVDAANPFAAENQAAANPFEGAYQNPFESGTVNPFAQ